MRMHEINKYLKQNQSFYEIINYDDKYEAKYEAYFKNKMKYTKQLKELYRDNIELKCSDINIRKYKNDLLEELFSDRGVFPWIV